MPFQDVLGKWTDNLDEHQQYISSRDACQKWLNELSKKLKQCKDMGDDKQSLEEKQSNIQVSFGCQRMKLKAFTLVNFKLTSRLSNQKKPVLRESPFDSVSFAQAVQFELPHVFSRRHVARLFGAPPQSVSFPQRY